MSDSRPHVVVVVSTPLAYRQILQSTFLARAQEHFRTEIWLAPELVSGAEPETPVSFRPMPAAHLVRRRGFSTLVRMHDAAWDSHLALPSRLVAHRLRYHETMSARVRATRAAGKLLGGLGLRGWMDRTVDRVLKQADLSPEATARFQSERPDMVVITWPHSWKEQAMANAASRLGIPVHASILSFDNLSTKRRFHLKLDHALVWSERMRAELSSLYAGAVEGPVSVVGAAQFDVFSDPALGRSREEHYARHGMDPAAPVVLYTLGSPQFLDETPGALRTAQALLDGRLGEDTQLLIRPHPFKEVDPALAAAAESSSRIRIQDSRARSSESAPLVDWVNTFRHADVVVNLASTTSIDAAVVDTPVVNIDFDPCEDGRQTALIKSINHEWPHFAPVNRSGGLALASDFEELFHHVGRYLADPTLDASPRRSMALDTIGFLDGRSGERYADALSEGLA